jgi:hypothetical protein
MERATATCTLIFCAICPQVCDSTTVFGHHRWILIVREAFTRDVGRSGRLPGDAGRGRAESGSEAEPGPGLVHKCRADSARTVTETGLIAVFCARDDDVDLVIDLHHTHSRTQRQRS